MQSLRLHLIAKPLLVELFGSLDGIILEEVGLNFLGCWNVSAVPAFELSHTVDKDLSLFVPLGLFHRFCVNKISASLSEILIRAQPRRNIFSFGSRREQATEGAALLNCDAGTLAEKWECGVRSISEES